MAERALPNLKLYLESRGESAPEVPDISVSWQAAIFEPDETSAVEVLDGIEAGEQVVMNPQSRFEDEIGELEAELASEEGDGLSDLKLPPAPSGRELQLQLEWQLRKSG